MSKLTIMVIPSQAAKTKQLTLPYWVFKSLFSFSMVLTVVFGYLILDYVELCRIRGDYQLLSTENKGLRGEAKALMANLEEVKQSLRRVQDYANKLSELTQVTVKKVSKKTGIGPLSQEEYDIAQKDALTAPPTSVMPIGINMDKLVFRSVFDRLNNVAQESNNQAFEMQKLLSNLSKQKSLLGSIPSIPPVDGWMTSGFGYRVSPFTGGQADHKGVDIAAPIGSAVYAPADGVVIFTGQKAGFGNFIMVAHGYGIVTRYGHNAENLVQPGQTVTRGEQIATVGMSGRTTGPHLHYEVLVNGDNVNPKKFILNLSEYALAH